MLRNNKKLARLLTASLAVAALAPATAGAVPAIDGNTGTQAAQGQSVAAGGGSGVTPQTLTAPTQANRVVRPNPDQIAPAQTAPDQVQHVVRPNPDQVNGSVKPTPANMPQWPLNPVPIAAHDGAKATPKSSDDGLSTDTIVLLIIGGVALVAAAGLGFARARAGRQRQLA